ncbi:MAG TPA: ergothioneine biosynthesis protein EgtB [Pyrinomonadaceae bacterium]|nr:ergothioneine biosynthesis protein EgtB [Pyrinomonadaceae bacterium]
MQAVDVKRSSVEELKEFYTRVRAYTEELCEPLEIEDYIPQPIVDVSPPKWHIAHTTWFFEEMVLKRFLPGYQVFDENFGFLFNSYYNSIGDRTARDHRGDLSRPTVKQVFEYRSFVDGKMLELLSGVSVQSSNQEGELRDLIILGLNHEQQHQELLLTDLKYTFAQNPLFPVYKESFAPIEAFETVSNKFIEMEGGTYDVGYNGDVFCFDNELARHKVFLAEYSIERKLVTNAEYIEFIEDGGYSNPLLWHSDGWAWVTDQGTKSPLYWQDREDGLYQYTYAGLRKVQPSAPVCHISFYEAAAFAEWKGCRLPTEFEWEAASEQFPWGLRWEWTNSAYLPYPGFEKGEGAVGEYNGKFMINQMVLRGASVVTPVGHSRSSYRNFFQPHLRWQFTGIRLAK